MTEAAWLVCYRNHLEVGHEPITAGSAADAADAVRVARPGCVVAAVFSLPLDPRRRPTNEFSDMPATYKTTDRFRGPVAGEHGYTLVSVRPSDGERSLWPGKAISYEDAVWRRDWMLRKDFERFFEHRLGGDPPSAVGLPRIVKLVEVDTLSLEWSDQDRAASV
jgi:hypothetical protein